MISGLAQDLRQGGFIKRQAAPLGENPMLGGISTGENGGVGRICGGRLCPCMLKEPTVGCQSIYVWRGDLRVAIAAKVICAQGIGCDQEDQFVDLLGAFPV